MKQASVFSLQSGWRILLKDMGIRPADVLRRAGLPDDLLTRQSVSLATPQYFALWRGLEKESGDPTLPIRLGRALTLEVFDAPIFAAVCSPNLTAAMRRLGRFKRLLAPMALHVKEESAGLGVEMEFLDKAFEPPNSLVAAELIFLVQLARLATREEIRPLAVTTRRPFEPAADYAEYFGGPVKSGPAHSLTFSARDAARPFLTANDGMWRFFLPQLRKRLYELDEEAGMSDRVRAALLELLPSGGASLRSVSRKLALSPRTLQRRLSGESTTFQRVLDATREELARHYLSGSSLSGPEISFLLGYEDPNSFFRAFHSWTGQTPEQARQKV